MQRLGRYNLVRRVGVGGMAEIWKAKVQGPAGFEKVVAIKRVLPQFAAEREFVELFIAEAKLVAKLVHPNIVQVFDFGMAESLDDEETRSDYYIAMEYVAGQNLATVLQRLQKTETKVPLQLAIYAVAEAAKALGYAHAETDPTGKTLSIVHRDVSPHNLLCSYKGEIKVTDFGIAKVASMVPHTAVGMLRGKIHYMSPEQARGEPLDRRSDIFSLGLVLYELVTGERVFSGMSFEEIHSKIVSFHVDSPAIQALPDPVRDIVRQACHHDRAERYQDATQMESELTWALGPGGAIQARGALATLMRERFEKENAREIEEYRAEETAGGVPKPDGSPSPSQLTLNPSQRPSGTDAFQKALREDEERQDVRTAASVEKPPSSVAQIGIEGMEIVPAIERTEVSRPRDRQVEATVIADHRTGTGAVPGHTVTKPRRLAIPEQSRPLVYGAFVMALVGTAAVGVFAGKALYTPGATPTPTPIAVVTTAAPTATPTAVAAVSTAAPTPTLQFVAVTSTPRPTPRPTARPTPKPTQVAIATPVPVHTPVAARNGYLTVFADPWCEVWVDGRRVAVETPLKKLSLPAGRHTIRFVNPHKAYFYEKAMDIPGDRETSFFVDVNGKSVKVQ